jgi:hypothetical protein
MKPKAILVKGDLELGLQNKIENFFQRRGVVNSPFVLVEIELNEKPQGANEFTLNDPCMFIIGELKVVNKFFLHAIRIDRNLLKSIVHLHHLFSKKFDLAFADSSGIEGISQAELSSCKDLGLHVLDWTGNEVQSSAWLLK